MTAMDHAGLVDEIMPFEIRLAEEAQDDLRGLRAFDRTRVAAGMEQQLIHQPKQVSKSRIKKMVEPFWCQYRLRVDEFRVYDVDDTNQVVNVLRIIEKGRDTTPEQNP